MEPMESDVSMVMILYVVITATESPPKWLLRWMPREIYESIDIESQLLEEAAAKAIQ